SERDRALLGELRLPSIVHTLPELFRCRVVPIGRSEIEVLDPFVAGDAVLSPEIRQARRQRTLRRQHGLEVVLLLEPARRQNRVTIRSDQHVIVVARAPLARWQRPPGLAADPRREA